MTLVERINAADWDEDDCRWFAAQVAVANEDAWMRDLYFAVVARLIGQDGADLMTLRRRAREIVDLAQAMQAEAAALGSAANRPRPVHLRLVGGRDV
jgi:hypothetical protein